MAITLKQSYAIRQLAGVLYRFLPGSGNQSWRGHVSFATIARDLGVGEYWPGGTKEPAIAALLEKTFDRRPERFEPLVENVIKHGLTYCQKKNDPIKRDEIETVNGLLQQVGFKFPQLWDEGFLASLPHAPPPQSPTAEEGIQGTPSQTKKIELQLAKLKEEFLQLAILSDRQEAGRKLESLLNEMFALFGLEPRPPFRVAGEQIDGSFVFDYATYLVEAKWTQKRTEQGPLLEFRGKIEGKSAFTRGAFISVNGFTGAAIEAITRGKSPTFFLTDGYDLMQVLNGEVDLIDLLRHKLRRLTEEGEVLVRLPLAH